MAGRNPKIDGRKAKTGAQGLVVEALGMAEAAGVPLPKTLGRLGKLAWREAIASLVPKGNLALIDMRALEMWCRQYEIWAASEERIVELEKAQPGSGEYCETPNGHRQMSAERITAGRAFDRYMRIAPLFGATPVGRIRTAGAAQGDLFNWAGVAEADPAAPTHDPTDPFGPPPATLQ